MDGFDVVTVTLIVVLALDSVFLGSYVSSMREMYRGIPATHVARPWWAR